MPTAVLRRTVSQLFMVGLPGPTVDRRTRAFFAEHPPGGVILFRRNVRSAAQLRALVAALHEGGAGVRPLIAIDHEGGRVHRLPRPFTHFPPAAIIGATDDPHAAEAVGRAMGRELAAVGIDLDFAPVLDVWSNPRNRVIGDRAFGREPRRVARMALALARGLLRAGVLACGKHFPGHGDTVGDSHRRLPRARLGFRGVLFSDDLEMGAVAGRRTPEEAAVAALAAGCDMLLVCRSQAAARRAMLGVEAALAAGRLDAADIVAALGRIEALRRRHRPRPRPGRLAWPAHARLAARLAAAPAR